MQLGSLTRPELIFPALDIPDRETLLRTIAGRLESLGRVPSGEDLYNKLLEREELESTALGGGVAIPHCKIEDLDEILLAVAIVQQGIDFAAADGAPAQIFFFIISSDNAPAAHLQCLAAISRWVKSSERVQRLLELENVEAIHAYLSEAET